LKRDVDILLAGAGIGGLAAALALLRQGFRVRVFEQAPALAEVGAGLTLSAGAVRCLAHLGLAEPVERMIVRTPGFPFLHYQTGRLLAGALPAPGSDRPASPPLSGGHMFRADLHRLLAEAVRAIDPDAIALGHGLTGFSQDADAVVLAFAHGPSARGQVLVGCDGVRSVVRAGVLGEARASFSGRIAYRFLLPAEAARPHLGEAGPAAVFIGPSKTINRYLISNDRVLNFVALSRSDRWSAEGWSHPATREEMIAEFEGWHPDLLALMALAPADKLIRWGVFQHPPQETWTRGRVTLLGDAAHPMLPFLGLGAAMAIEDGVILGRAFAEADGIESALHLYQAARIPRTTRVFHGSRLQGEIFDTLDPEHYPPANAPAHDPALSAFNPEAPLADLAV
jgi:salicylate hydroxylase